MRSPSMGPAAAAILAWAVWVPSSQAVQQLPRAVYLAEADVPCPYETVGSIGGPISARSLQEYVLQRDRRVLGGASARGGNAAFISEDEHEPGSEGVGFPVDVVDGVPQLTEREVTATAIRMTTEGCPAAQAIARVGEFEGTITYAGTFNGDEMPPSIHYIRGTRFRQEMQTPGSVQALVIDEIGRMGRTVDPQLPEGLPVGLPPVSGAHLVVTEISETDTIAGVQCRMVRLQVEDHDLTICVASGFGVTSGGVTPPRIGLVGLALAFPEGFLPLRVVRNTSEGTSEVVATSFEPGRLDDALFEALGER